MGRWVGWLVGRDVARLAGGRFVWRLAGSLVGWLASWQVGWLVGG